MNTDQVRHFVAVSRLGSVTAAAQDQHISQPALSRSLRHLEDDLGVTLFDRGKNSLSLNATGRELLPRAEDLLRSERLLRQAAQDASRRDRVLRLGTIAPAPLWYLTSLVVGGIPGTLLSTEMMDDEAALEHELFDGVVDLAITSREVPGMRHEELMRESLFVSAPSDHPLASRESVSFADLAGETFLLYQDIGFWKGVHQRMMPQSHFLVQNSREVWDQLMRTTGMLGFSSDAPTLVRPAIAGERDGSPVDRVFVPISDPEAHATFYLCARDGDASTPRILDRVFQIVADNRPGDAD